MRGLQVSPQTVWSLNSNQLLKKSLKLGSMSLQWGSTKTAQSRYALKINFQFSWNHNLLKIRTAHCSAVEINFQKIFRKISDFQKNIRFSEKFQSNLKTCYLRLDTWETDYISDNWEQQYEQLHCALWIQSDGDSIRNSCDVFATGATVLHWW